MDSTQRHEIIDIFKMARRLDLVNGVRAVVEYFLDLYLLSSKHIPALERDAAPVIVARNQDFPHMIQGFLDDYSWINQYRK